MVNVQHSTCEFPFVHGDKKLKICRFIPRFLLLGLQYYFNKLRKIPMLRKIAACLLALSALNSQAAEQAYEFSYTGASLDGVWDANVSTGGKFIVDDLNGDGVFTLPEVKSFTYRFPAVQHCGEDPSIRCTLSEFNYDPKGALTLWYSYSQQIGNGTPPSDGGSISDSIAVTPD
ncbi:hypothetical protein F2P44_24750 [Massilia sp. CCM 8695]|uniref:Uncharacterized protein n=1 Tax=Massilia frigida TaxID=2609281 RepID=A0ABX0NBE8_9BURK|nr:hypothetical protein [Massilia frigida]NHZ82464.1 hypothetical protein [Massilia frigida]